MRIIYINSEAESIEGKPAGEVLTPPVRPCRAVESGHGFV